MPLAQFLLPTPRFFKRVVGRGKTVPARGLAATRRPLGRALALGVDLELMLQSSWMGSVGRD